jgi:hypothetical protein
MFTVRVRSSASGALLSARAIGEAPEGWVRGYSQVFGKHVEVASDSAAADVELLLPAGFEGHLVVERLDLGTQALDFQVETRVVQATKQADVRNRANGLTVRANRGQSVQLDLPTAAYSDLVALANGYGTREFQEVATKRRAYQLISAVIGREEG